MTTETSVTNLKINKLTKAQYDTITRSSTEAYEITDLGSILDSKQTTSNLVTTISASSTDAQYPSAKCVYDALQSGGGGISYSATCPAITPTSGVASWSVNHNLGTANIVASLYNSSGALQECNVTVTSANAITVNFKASSNVSAGDYKIVVLASGGTPNSSSPQIYLANGFILDAQSDSAKGLGTATVLLHNSGLAEIQFNLQITTKGTNGSNYNWGINSNLLSSINNNIPTITSTLGGWFHYFNPNGYIDNTLEGYGGTFYNITNNYWLPSRIADTNAGIGGYSSATLAVNYRISGVAYGTYEV